MFGPSRVPEDVSVASVEEILDPVRRRYPSSEREPKGGPVASYALWICACVSMDDAPTWLLYSTAEDGVAWCRVPDRIEPLDLVQARLSAGGHADPSEVLLWLQGRAPDPWAGGYGDGDSGVIQELRRK